MFRLRLALGQRGKVLSLEGTQLGPCVVESKAPAVTTASRWRVRCSCGGLFYLDGTQVVRLAKTASPDYCCPDCKARRRREASTLRLQCEVCSSPYELSRYEYERRANPKLCCDCAQSAGRLRLASGRKCSRCGELGHNRRQCPRQVVSG
jgi:hypothetical protein